MTKTTKKNIVTLITASLLASSCSERVYFSSFASRGGSNPPASSKCDAGNCTDSFSQKNGEFVTDKAAVIFFVDTSGSMANDKDDVSLAASKLAEELAKEGFSKACFGVMPGLATKGQSGKLSANAAGEYCICADKVAIEEIDDKLLSIFNTFQYNGSGPYENPDLAAYNFLTDQAVIDFNAQVSGGRCGGGDDTAMFLIGTSDEESQRAAKSKPIPTATSIVFAREGTTLYQDNSETEVRRDFMSKLNTATNKYDDIFTTESIKGAFNNYCGTLPCDYSFIGHTSNAGITAPEEVNTFAQKDVAAMGGEYVDIKLARTNSDAFVQTFVDQLKPKLSGKLRYLEIFDTKFSICDSKPFKVIVDGVDVTAFAEKIDVNRIKIKSPKNEGQNVSIEYVIDKSSECGN